MSSTPPSPPYGSNAIKNRDERDKQIARTGFAVVGIVALIVSVAVFVVVSASSTVRVVPAAESFLVGQMLLLAIVWAVSNAAPLGSRLLSPPPAAVRRGTRRPFVLANSPALDSIPRGPTGSEQRERAVRSVLDK